MDQSLEQDPGLFRLLPDLYRQTLQKCNLMYYQFNSMLTSEIPLKDQSFEMFLSELGNYSYHSGLDVG